MKFLNLKLALSLPVALMGLCSSAFAVDAACVGKVEGYFFPTKVAQVDTACLAGKSNACSKIYSNYCFGGKVQSIFIYETCAPVACTAPAKTTTPATTSTASPTTATGSAAAAGSSAASPGGSSSGGSSSGGASSGGSSSGAASSAAAPAATATAGAPISTKPVVTVPVVIVPVVTAPAASAPAVAAPVATTPVVTTPVATAPAVATPVAAAPAALFPTANKNLVWGVGGPSILNTQYVAAFKVLNQRGLKSYRINVNLTADNPGVFDQLAAMQAAAKAAGITLKPILFTQFQWADNAAGPRNTKVDRNALYRDAYDRTYAIAERFRNDINDWELGNEVNLRTRYDNGGVDISPPASWKAASFDTPRMNDWASVLKGQADAIAVVNLKYKTHLRSVLNTTGLDFGFLDLMQTKGVNFDVISYHYYEKLGLDMNNYWNGPLPKVSLFKSLAKYGKPIIVNETNCAEIYNDAYVNREGGNLTTQCLQSFNNILVQIENQKDANIEGVIAYTLVDIPNVTPPAETRFGMMFDLAHPKTAMAVLSAHSGGLVTADERAKLVGLGILK